MHLLWEWYGQIWPNWAASLTTVIPLFVWHHIHIRGHQKRIEAKIDALSDQKVDDGI